MKRRYGKIYCIMMLLTVLLTGCAGESGMNPADPEKAAENSSVRNAAEKQEKETEAASSGIVFEGKDLDGNSVSNTVFSEAKLTMINVWATYCNPCLSEMPGLGELAASYDPKELRIIGVISDVTEDADEETIAAAAELIEATGADYTHLLLSESVYFALLKDVTAVPTTFFIDENGTVLDTVVGAMEKSAWEEKINALLEEQ